MQDYKFNLIENADIKLNGKPVEKLVETLGKGLGAVPSVWLIPKIAEAEAKAAKIKATSAAEIKLIEAQTSMYEKDILEGKKILQSDGTLLEVTEITEDSLPDVKDNAYNMLTYQSIKRQNNLKSIFDKAIYMLPDEVSEETVDDDWIAQYTSHAQDVSSDEMQEYWAKILVEEVASPNTVSKRTLEVLKNLSRVEAEKFESIFPYLIFDALPNDRSLDDYTGITHIDFLELVEAGVLSSTNSMFNRKDPTEIPLELGSKYKFVMTLHVSSNGVVFILGDNKSKMEVTIPEYALTKSGKEIYNIINKTSLDDDYLAKVFSRDALKNKYDVIRFAEGRKEVGYTAKDILSQDNKIICKGVV